MNYEDELMLYINTVHKALVNAGHTLSADSVEHAANVDGTVGLMAAADYARYHLELHQLSI